MFQSTHPHGVRHFVVHLVSLTLSFNPRTHMGCDQISGAVASTADSFNPRTHMGCDFASVISIIQSFVSIHAPTWGATELFNANMQSLMFQSTHPHGVRHFVINKAKCKNKFQSTHPHGVRRSFVIWLPLSSEFQSTHPHGVRLHIQ